MFVYCPSGQVSRLAMAFFWLDVSFFLFFSSFSIKLWPCPLDFGGRQNSGTGEYGETGTLGEMNDMRFISCSTVTLLSVAPLAPFSRVVSTGTNSNLFSTPNDNRSSNPRIRESP